MGLKKKSSYRIIAPTFNIAKKNTKDIKETKRDIVKTNVVEKNKNEITTTTETSPSSSRRTITPLKKRRKSILSLNNILKEKETNGNEDIIDYANMPKDDFTYEQMLKCWYEYAETLNNKGDYLLYSAMIREEPKLEKNTIICSILNNTLAAKFESENIKIIEFIRKKLNNFSIQIETPITKLEETKQVYTSRDRFEYMLKKNELLKDFVTKLKLDLV
jgi:DNA polymerase-3 subunit gamma/tau